MVDFVGPRTTATFITQCPPQTDGTRLNTILVLLGITGRVLKRARTYSRTTAGQDRTCTTISADGAVTTTEAKGVTILDFATRRQREHTRTHRTTTDIL